MRKRTALLVAPLVLAGCNTFNSAPRPVIPPACEAQVYADPKVKDLLVKSAGSYTFARNNEDALNFAKIDANRRCMQQKGLAPAGGGVERPAARS